MNVLLSSALFVSFPWFFHKILFVQSVDPITKQITIKDAWENLIQKGSLFGFPSYSQATRFLDYVASNYSSLFTKFPIGISIERRIIYGYRLHQDKGSQCSLEKSISVENPPLVYNVISNQCVSRHFFKQQPKGLDQLVERLTGESQKSSFYCAKLLLTSLHHAREPASLTTLLYLIQKIIFDYLHRPNDASQEQAAYLLKQRDIILVPFINPDGYVALKKNRWIRKNRRRTCDSDRLSDGVDLNRNYGFHFANIYDKCHFEEYEGAFPFSEPETQAIRCLVFSLNFQAAIHLHSYGHLWTRPFNCCPNKTLPTSIERIYNAIAIELEGQSFDPAPKIFGSDYITSGEADDWFLHDQGIISMSPEVGSVSLGFWPPPSHIENISRFNYMPIVSVLMKAGLEYFITPIRTHNKTLCSQILLFNEGFGPYGYEPLHIAVVSSDFKNSHNDTDIDFVIILSNTISGLGPQKTHVVSLDRPLNLRTRAFFFCVHSDTEQNAYCHCGHMNGFQRIKLVPSNSTNHMCGILLSVSTSRYHSVEFTPASLFLFYKESNSTTHVWLAILCMICLGFIFYRRFRISFIKHLILPLTLRIASLLCCCPYCTRLYRRLRYMSYQDSLSLHDPESTTMNEFVG